MPKSIYDDPVVAEIHAIRQTLLDACGGNIDEYRKRTYDRQAKAGRRIVSTPLKKREERSTTRDPEHALRHG